MVKVTVFTPTYNRGYAISNLYNSLCRQSNSDFEWIVIDDGSTDNTESIIRELINKNNKFEIIYKKQNNEGKHIAINHGVRIANGELFFIVDSDDYLIDTAIEKIIHWEVSIRDKNNYAGLSGLKGNLKGIAIGDGFPNEFVDYTSIELRNQGYKGDKAEVFYTQILKNYPFPKFSNETFLDEAIVWYKIANDGYKIRWFNEVIYICDYLEDGLTKNLNNIIKRNFDGYTTLVKELYTYPICKKHKIILIGKYVYLAKELGYSFRKIKTLLNVNILQLYLFYQVYKIKI